MDRFGFTQSEDELASDGAVSGAKHTGETNDSYTYCLDCFSDFLNQIGREQDAIALVITDKHLIFDAVFCILNTKYSILSVFEIVKRYRIILAGSWSALRRGFQV